MRKWAQSVFLLPSRRRKCDPKKRAKRHRAKANKRKRREEAKKAKQAAAEGKEPPNADEKELQDMLDLDTELTASILANEKGNPAPGEGEDKKAEAKPAHQRPQKKKEWRPKGKTAAAPELQKSSDIMQNLAGALAGLDSESESDE